MIERQVVVIGAGPAGLATAAELGRLAVPALVVDKADAVGSSWRGRYDRLRLNSSRPFSGLPGARWPRGTAMFPTRDQVVRYLEDYAHRHELRLQLGTSVERIDRADEGWLVRMSAGELPANSVVVATGYDGVPFVPDWPGRDRFRGSLVHAARYREPSPYRDRDVLVVGSGCSAMEIAYELSEGGAARVRLAVRTSPNILVRSPAGPAIARSLLRFPPAVGDRVVNVARRFEVGDLSEYGLPVPEEGVFSRLRRLGVAPAIIDKETLAAIKQRRIEIVPGVESLDEDGVTLAGGVRVEPDDVVAATGYRTGLEPLVGHLGVLDERGVPRALRGREAAPGLRFVGYEPRPAHLGYLGPEGRSAARAISAGFRRPSADGASRARTGFRPAAAPSPSRSGRR